MESCTVCKPWSAHKAKRLGLIGRMVPALKIDGEFVPNPRVVTERYIDEKGDIVYGEPRTGEDSLEAKRKLQSGEVDLTLLDLEVDNLVYELAMLMPGCLSKTIESLRKHKLEHWDRNRETNRAWLGLNMMTEGRTGFRAFHEGTRECREGRLPVAAQTVGRGPGLGVKNLSPKSCARRTARR